MGAKCGKLREACLSDTDKRYAPGADYDVIAQNDLWSRISGFYKIVGTSYTGNGNVRSESSIEYNGLTVSFSLEDVMQYTNTTVRGTRVLFDINFFAQPLPNNTFPFGVALRWESYGTSTFELDGSVKTMPRQDVVQSPGNWTEGFTSLSRVVDKSTIFALSYAEDGSSQSLVRTCLDPSCNKITEVQQFFTNGSLGNFFVAQGERITADQYTAGIQGIIKDYNIFPSLIPTFEKEFGQNFPTEEKWCESDPACGESPYQEPVTPLKTGPLVGFVILGLVILFAAFYAFYSTMMVRKEKRIKRDFNSRMRQSITFKSFSGNNAKQFEEVFNGMDKDGNGYIEKGELREYMNKRETVMPESDFSTLWKSLDADNSGKIDYLEFCAFMAKCNEDGL